jgi:hypothetical protein
MKKIKLCTEIVTKLGTYRSDPITVNELEFTLFKKTCVNYSQQPFEAHMEDGTYYIIPVSVLEESVFLLKIIEIID